MLLIFTCTPFRELGNGTPDSTWTPGARFVPYSKSNSPGAIPAVKVAELPAFTTPVGLRLVLVNARLVIQTAQVGRGRARAYSDEHVGRDRRPAKDEVPIGRKIEVVLPR